MTKQNRKLIATFKGPVAEAFENDRVELTNVDVSYVLPT